MLPGYRAPRKFLFLSTLSLRRATLLISSARLDSVFLSTLSLRRATHAARLPRPAQIPISIHALLAESDFVNLFCEAGFCISIHALLAESDGSTAAVVVVVWVFLSTLSLRRATATTGKQPAVR